MVESKLWLSVSSDTRSRDKSYVDVFSHIDGHIVPVCNYSSTVHKSLSLVEKEACAHVWLEHPWAFNVCNNLIP